VRTRPKDSGEGRKLLNRQPSIVNPIIIILAIAAVGGMFWANHQYLSKEEGGNDFVVYWNSGRTVLFENATPYGELASLRSQGMIFGLSGRAGDPPLMLDLPFQAEIFILPFALIADFNSAGALWMALLEVAIVVTVFMTWRFLRWKPSPLLGAAIILFSIFFVHGLWAVILGNAVILSGLIVAGVMLALHEDYDELAGILLALGIFKLMSIGFLLIYIFIWVAFGRRNRMLVPFGMTLLILVAISFFFFPNWFLPYARAIYANLHYGDWLTPSKIFQEALPFVGEKLGWVLSGLSAAVLLTEWWLARRGDFSRMVWTASLTLAMTPLLGLPTYPQNYVILTLPLIAAFSVMSKRWRASGNYIILILLAFLFFGLWAVAHFASDVKSALFFPMPVVVLVMLYWIRWWAISRPLDSMDAVIN
jgi:hypothetical protein